MSREPAPSPVADRAAARPAASRDVAPLPIVAMGPDGAREKADWVAVEEPMEIRAHGPGQEPASVAVTMRTTMAMPNPVPVTMKDRDAGFTASLSDPAMTAVWVTRAAPEPRVIKTAARISVGRAQLRLGPSELLKA